VTSVDIYVEEEGVEEEEVETDMIGYFQLRRFAVN
jgi:hypothetical protein